MSESEWIEEIVLQRPELRSTAEVPPAFAAYHDQLAPSLSLPTAIAATLETFPNEDLRARKIKEAFAELPSEREGFIRHVRLSRQLEEADCRTLDQAILRYGLDRSRNLLLAAASITLTENRTLEWDEASGEPKVNVERRLYYALLAAQELGEASRFGHRAFAAGFVFDLLKSYSQMHCPRQQMAHDSFISQTFDRGLATTRVFLALSKQMTKLEMAEYALAATLLHEIGQVGLIILEPGYLELAGALKQKQIPPALAAFAEEQRFGLTHTMIGYQICNTFPVFPPIASTILYSRDPYLAVALQSPAVAALTSTIWLASNISRMQLRLPSDVVLKTKYHTDQDRLNAEKSTEEGVRLHWMRTELSTHELSPLTIHRIVQTLRT